MERVRELFSPNRHGRRAMLAMALCSLVAPGGLRAARSTWTGPQDGPRGSGARHIAVLAEDLRNGGVLGVAQGLREAGRQLKWTLHVFDAGGSIEGRRRVLREALDRSADGMAVCGMDGETFDAECRRLSVKPGHVVGWHVGERPGPMKDSLIATNVSTDPEAVARAAAQAAVPDGQGRAGIVIFTDSRFAIATAKTRAMAAEIHARPDAHVLEVLDVPISGSREAVPALVARLVRDHGARWTHALAINDIYFDHAVPMLIALGQRARHVRLISAGDGSASAFVRIRSGAYQTATVAEPLNMQGWQMADELNRLFMGHPVTGFVTPVSLVTRDELVTAGAETLVFDPPNGYRDVYRRIWSGGV
nr:substrate-binding domain-containing protein [uncultured Caldimonas sp.]